MTHYSMKQCEHKDEGQKLLRIYHIGEDAYPVYWNALSLCPKNNGRKRERLEEIRPRQWALFGSRCLPCIVHMMALHQYLRYVMVATACAAFPHCSEFLEFCKEKPQIQSHPLPDAHPRLIE